eukprot:7381123-Prymnesium_polylepis.1
MARCKARRPVWTGLRRSDHDPKGRTMELVCSDMPSWATHVEDGAPSPAKAVPPPAKISQPPLKTSFGELPYDIMIIISMLVLQAWCEAPRVAEVNHAMKYAMEYALSALSPAVMKAAGACLHLSRSEPKDIGAVGSSPFVAVLASAGGVM